MHGYTQKDIYISIFLRLSRQNNPLKSIDEISDTLTNREKEVAYMIIQKWNFLQKSGQIS